MSIPKLTREQRLQALEKAFASRKERADFKEKIHRGEYTCKEALEIALESDSLKRIKTIDFIRSFRSYGEARAEKLMLKIGISESRRIGGLGYKQINSLIIAIDGK